MTAYRNNFLVVPGGGSTSLVTVIGLDPETGIFTSLEPMTIEHEMVRVNNGDILVSEAKYAP